MVRANEGKSDNGKWKKSELLPQGGEAEDIIEVLAAMYWSTHNSEAAANDDRSANCELEDICKEVHNADN